MYKAFFSANFTVLYASWDNKSREPARGKGKEDKLPLLFFFSVIYENASSTSRVIKRFWLSQGNIKVAPAGAVSVKLPVISLDLLIQGQVVKR